MKVTYLIAAVLSIFAAVVRTIDGISGPLKAARETTLEPVVVGFFYLTWHMVTVVFVASAVALFFLARSSATPRSSGLGLFIGLVSLVWSVLIAAISFSFVWDVATVVPMVVTFLIGVLSLMGARSSKVQANV